MRQLLLSVARPNMKIITLQLFRRGGLLEESGMQKIRSLLLLKHCGGLVPSSKKFLMLLGFALMHPKLESNLACKLNMQLKQVCWLDIWSRNYETTRLICGASRLVSFWGGESCTFPPLFEHPLVACGRSGPFGEFYFKNNLGEKNWGGTLLPSTLPSAPLAACGRSGPFGKNFS